MDGDLDSLSKNLSKKYICKTSCDFKFFGRLPQIPLPQFVMMHKDLFIRNIPQGRLCAAVRLLIISKKSSEEQTMHMADAFLSPAVAVTMYAASAAAAGVSLVQLRREELAAPETAKK